MGDMSKTEMILLAGSLAVILLIGYLFYKWVTDKNQDKGPFDRRIPPGT